ncbi:MAG: hypothetical protein ACK5YA_00570 [bacterium]
MGSSCGCNPSNVERNAKEILKYKKIISEKLMKYSFDGSNKDEFINKVCKENNINKDIAKIWIDLYLEYMICIGFNYDKTPSKAVKKQMDEDMNRILAIPYELLQIWRVHVLYTKKYEEFCDIVTRGGNKAIPFIPPKQVWKSADPNTISSFFRFNHSLMSHAFAKKKTEIDSIFVFQSSYLKNTLHFCLYDSVEDSITQRIVNAYNVEANNENGVFKMAARDINSMKTLSANIENMIFRAVVPNEPIGNYEWHITENVYGNAIQKVPVFQNLSLPANFVVNFGIDHLLSLNRANDYVNEYKKFLFVSFVGNASLCPSEQVDLVWHYHQCYTKQYRDFSKMIMNTEVYGHNPIDGSESDFNKYKEVYNLTLTYLISSFGNLNTICWPHQELRFSQIYRWYNHHQFMSQTRIYQEGKIYQTTTKTVQRNIYLGCSIG